MPLCCCGGAEPGGGGFCVCFMKDKEILIGPWRVRMSCEPGGYGPSYRCRHLVSARGSWSIEVVRREV